MKDAQFDKDHPTPYMVKLGKHSVSAPCHLPRNMWLSAAVFPKHGTMEHQTLTLIYEGKVWGQLIWKTHLSPLGDPQSKEHVDDSDKSY